MLSTLKDLWYDGKMVTKEKQLRIFDEKSGKWEVFSPVIFSKLYAAGRGYNLSAHDYFTWRKIGYRLRQNISRGNSI